MSKELPKLHVQSKFSINGSDVGLGKTFQDNILYGCLILSWPERIQKVSLYFHKFLEQLLMDYRDVKLKFDLHEKITILELSCECHIGLFVINNVWYVLNYN